MKLPCALLSLFFCLTPLAAQDLTQIDRTIRKEPAYQSKQPKYCLLVFGPEATHRVWLVHDGDTLYVDRNGNGDLTEPGKKVAAKKGDRTDSKEGEFEAGDIPEGKLLHKNLRLGIGKLSDLAEFDELIQKHLAKHPQARGYRLHLEVEMPGWKSVGLNGRLSQSTFVIDAQGILDWSDNAATAPVVHFRGPWHLMPFGPSPKLVVGRSADFILSLGTPGVSPGTTVYTDYEGVVPEKAFPKVEITYPPARPGEPPVQERYELKERC